MADLARPRLRACCPAPVRYGVLSSVLLAAALAGQEPTTVPSVPATPASVVASTPHEQTLAVVWMQRSAEYRAACLQAFRAAVASLETAIDDASWTACLEQQHRAHYEGLPPAVIVDVDETLLDNTAFAARQIVAGKGFEAAAWAAWVHEQQAPAIPGALAYVHTATRLGARVIYITNRNSDTQDGAGGTEETDTRQNLTRLGFPIVEADGEDLVLTAGEVGDKAARRASVGERFRIVQIVGDNLGDFAPGTEPRKAAATPHGRAVECAAVEQRRGQLASEFIEWWGERWILIPNPSYGGFETVVRGQHGGLAAALRLQK